MSSLVDIYRDILECKDKRQQYTATTTSNYNNNNSNSENKG